MRGIKVLLSTTALLAGLALAPAAQAQISIGIGIQPVCSYGYYGYAPYACAPMGFYGPGYFYDGIFLGMGPWGGWGYSHGWGSHRFVAEGGGNYHGGPGPASYHENRGAVRGGQVHSNAAVSHGGARPSAGHATVTRTSAPVSHASAPRAQASHASAPRAAASRPSGGGGAAHGGGERK